MRSSLRLASLLALLAAIWLAPPAEAAFGGCPAGVSPGIGCETFPVPLDWSGHAPGSVNLFVEREATATTPSPGALFVLAGGPGQAATPYTDIFAQLFAAGLSQRNLIVFDQRGTGRSDRIDCPAADSATTLSATDRATTACADSLGARRGFYTSRDSAQDIDALRQSLGVDRIMLYGVSYGTYAAMTYARLYPQHVEALILDSVISPGGRAPFDQSSFAAYPRVLRDICRGDCGGITSNPVGDLSRLVHRVERRRERTVVYGANGRGAHVTISSASVLGALVGADLDPTARAELPAALHTAAAGDAAALARLIRREDSAPGSVAAAQAAPPVMSTGAYLATLCEESPLPWSRTAPLSARPAQYVSALDQIPASAFAPWARAIELDNASGRACLDWPDASPQSPAVGGPLPNVPALILDGVDDTRTPLSDAQQAAALLPQASFVPVPDTGHSVLGTDVTGCSQSELGRWLSGAGASQCPAKAHLFAAIADPPRSVRVLHATRGIRGERGRTATAVRATIQDALQQGLAYLLTGRTIAAGGLRGGHLSGRLSRAGVLSVRLSRIVYVPGVRVSGTLTVDLTGRHAATAKLNVAGRAAARGTLRFTGSTLRGRLGGRAVHSAGISAASFAPPLPTAALALIRAGGLHPLP